MSASRWALAALIAVAAALRFSGLEAKTFWGDEVVCLMVATGHSWYPWMGEETALFYSADYYRSLVTLDSGYYSQRLIPLLRINDQIPPFYYLVLNLWIHLFGTSVAAIRALPLIASVASVPVIYALGRALFSDRAGIYAAAIFAVAPFQVAFGLYNRPYALLCFLALTSTLAAVRLSGGDGAWKWLALFAVSAIAGVYTHYLFVWNLIFQLALVVWYQRRNARLLRRFAVSCLVVGGVCLLWAPTFLEQMRWSREASAQSWFYWYTGSPTLANAVTSLGRIVLLLLTVGRVNGFCSPAPGGESCQIDNAITIALYLVPLAVLAFCAWQILLRVLRSGDRNALTPDPWIVCVAWMGCVLAGPALMDTLLDSHMVFSHRYFIAAAGPLYLAVAIALAGIAQPVLRRATTVSFVAFLLAGTAFYLRGRSITLIYEVPTRQIAQHVDTGSGGTDLILVLDPGLNPTDFALYLRSNPDFARVDVPSRRPSASSIAEQLTRITAAKERRRVWYLEDQGVEAQAHDDVLDWLRTNLVAIEERDFTSVRLFQFAPRNPAAGGSRDR